MQLYNIVMIFFCSFVTSGILMLTYIKLKMQVNNKEYREYLGGELRSYEAYILIPEDTLAFMLIFFFVACVSLFSLVSYYILVQ